MPPERLTGSRIREKRVMAAMKQAELAERIGISPSYLNLIEHNKRRIGGKLLLEIAAALDVEPQTLTEGAEAALLASLREAADAEGLHGSDADRADEFAGRFPAWADVLARARRRIATLEATVEALTDRMNHDPQLAASMHELLSTATAIRSTAAILAETKTLQPEWRERFHANINEDATRLSASAEALVTYLDAQDEAGEAIATPQEEVEAFLQDHGFNFDALETAKDTEAVVAGLVASDARLTTTAARQIAEATLRRIAADAQVLGLGTLREAVAADGTDPLTLAARLGRPVGLVLRRLAALPELGAGLVVCDRAGCVTFRKPVEGFNVPRHGACCPLWPLFAVLNQPGLVLQERLSQPGRSLAQFDCVAACEADAAPGYNRPPLVRAVMLLLPVAGGGPSATPVGASCRVCPQEGCIARREPSILGGTNRSATGAIAL